MRPMDDTQKQLMDFYNDLSQVSASGDEAKVEEFMKERFTKLPEDMQGELLARMYLESVAQKVEGEDALAAVQERALQVLGESEKESGSAGLTK